MMWMTPKTQSESWSKELVGGKAYHLWKLTHWGYRVPDFGVVTSKASHFYFKNGHLPQELTQQITQAVQSWGNGYFAVRSSMSREDGAQNSFAGIFDTFLYTKPEDILKRIYDCFKSIHSDRAKVYFENAGITDLSNIGVAVVVQKMIPSVYSGVGFSRSPTLSSGLVYLEGGCGLGEGIVSGLVEVDSYWVDRFGFETKRVVREKTQACLYDPQRGKVELKTLPSTDTRAGLTTAQSLNLAKMILEIESHMSCPADVEWALGPDQELYILQARAITTETTELHHYADTNLAESYPGIVSPLTAEFIPMVYTKVIGEAVEILGAPPSHMKVLRPSLDSLIKEFHGHLYYHLNSYYNMLEYMPGGKSNIEAWHKMIGGSLTITTTAVLPYKNIWHKFINLFSLAKLSFLHKKIFGDFLGNSFRELDQRQQFIESQISSSASAALPMIMIREIKDWGLTILNDFLVIIGLKALGQQLKIIGAPDTALLQLLRTKEGVDSLGALNKIKALGKELDNSFFEAIEDYKIKNPQDTDLDGLYKYLKLNNFPNQIQKIEIYLAEFGDRAFEELKLECMTFSQDPKEFLKLLYWFSQQEDSAVPLETPHITHDLPQMSFLRRMVLKFWVKFTEQAVQARESTRLMRGRFYGLIRMAVLKSAVLLQKEHPNLFGKLSKSDFFYLNLSDWENYSKGTLNAQSLYQRLFEKKQTWPKPGFDYPEKFATPLEEEKPYWISLTEESTSLKDSEILLTGMGASEGEVTGRAFVISDPRKAMDCKDLEERILVTRSTDPAWIFVMSKCKGLVSEKGSLLSHTAIVGRELRIPTVVGVPRAFSRIKDSQMIRINGIKGTVEILD